MNDIIKPLSAGTHLVPADGSCLMEAVSLATGDRWTDSPSSTHPLLAHLARLVNDAVTDEVRPELTVFIPDLIGTNRTDPLDHARIAHACAEYAATLGHSSLLDHLQHVAARRLDTDAPDPRASAPRRALHAARQWGFEHGSARHTVEAAVAQCSRHGDEHLVRLLEAGTLSCRG